MRSERVLIAGGGIGGLACALALAQQGIGSAVLERSPQFKEIGAGIQLGANVFKIFDRLGLTQAITEVAWFPDRLVMVDALSGEEVVASVLGDSYRARFGFRYGVIHRADLHQVLVDACRKRPGIDLVAGASVERIDQSEVEVFVECADGRRFSGALLVGADGLWSKVRQVVLADGPPRVSGHIAYRGVLPRSAVPEHLWSPSVVLWAGPKTHLVHDPLRRGELFNLVAVFHSEQYAEGWDAAADPAELHTKFAHAQPQVRELLSKIETWKMWVLCDREPAANWTQGRITLLGDAAHPMLQYLAAGAGMAIEDAWVLARCLAHAPDYPERALLDYQNQRYLRTGRVQYTARFFGELYHATGVARDLRKQLLGTPRARGADNPMAWLYDGIE
jgi:2-polyprenyl-6-methoxyphenol hydroxylase-like FAD-dependent oxidoreductase